ncbi:hypothetical protein BVX97_05190 [bacterium E08(2017)]|nr:hypothetical protein BVX97_05190 [bacterium E08(2017)]
MNKLILSVTVFLGAVLFAEESGASSDVLRFGDYLYEKGEYYRAITEYERYQFLKGSPDAAVSYRIGLSYYMGEQYKNASKVFESVHLDNPGSDVGRDSLLMLADCIFQSGEYRRAAMHLSTLPKADTSAKIAIKLAWCDIWDGSSDDAGERLNGLVGEGDDYDVARDLAGRFKEYDDLPSKSPGFAAFLSAVLPGAGQLYDGRYKDAGISFFMNGLMLWAAIEGFNNDQEVAGSFAAFLEVGFYAGNVYNAASSAHKYNRDVREKYLKNLGIEYGISIAEDSQKELRPVLGVKKSF